MTWIILLWIFQGYSLFSYQCSLLFSATLIYYHIQKCLSITFLFFFFNSSELMCCRFDSFDILSNRLSFVNNFFKKIRTTYIANKSGERGIWTLAPVARPTPLAGAPLRPLEYFSAVIKKIFNCILTHFFVRRVSHFIKENLKCQANSSKFFLFFYFL